MSKSISSRLLGLISVLVFSVSIFAGDNLSDDNVWREIDESDIKQENLEKFSNSDSYKVFRLSKKSLRPILNKAPLEGETFRQQSGIILNLPMPDGNFSRFRIKESPIMQSGLAAKFPNIRTYIGQGIDDPTATTRFDMTQNGFRAIVLSKNGTTYLEPYAKNNTENYISFNKQSALRNGEFVCLFDEENIKDESFLKLPEFKSLIDLVENGTILRTYRLAVAATGEYTAFHGGTVETAMAAIVTTMNRVNGIYERDLSIRMVLVENNDQIIYTDGSTDPYSNNSGGAMLGQNQTNVNAVIGSDNYDIGHVFSTGGGGVASLNSPCGSGKARGVTGLGNPQGDVFDVDYVSHEMGHQYGGRHTFNGSSSSCSGGNRSSSAAYEPGSGSTIQAYAGICTPQNLQRNTDDYFHVKSLEEMNTFANGSGSCSVNTPTENTPPNVSVSLGVSSFNIPKQTPFALTASATDVDGDTITYNWEQYDLGPASTSTTGDSDEDGQERPIFRSYPSTDNPTRNFPSLQYILNNSNTPPLNYDCNGRTCVTGEILPSISRTMNFQVTARDNRANGGGINTANAEVIVDGNSGPFILTSQNESTTWKGGTTQTITWDVANTDASPIEASNIEITLSTDGGETFSRTILENTPNDGSQAITVPNVNTTNARIKIKAVDNIFFDINDADLSVSSSTSSTAFDFDGDGKTDVSIFRPDAGQWWYLRSSDLNNAAFAFGTSSDKLVPADFTGDGITDVAFWRESTGEWFILRSEDSSFFGFPFGTSGDIPAPGDFDGDGIADAAVFRPSTATWFIQRSSDGGTTITPFGVAEDRPTIADYDGDGKDDIAIFRPSVSEWWQLRSQDGVIAYQFGASGDKTIQGDYTGDGKADVGIFRPSTGNWLILRSEDTSFFGFPFGTSTDIPSPGDYDGDGTFDAAVFRPSTNTWFYSGSTSGNVQLNFGIDGDIPIPNVYSVQ